MVWYMVYKHGTVYMLSGTNVSQWRQRATDGQFDDAVSARIGSEIRRVRLVFGRSDYPGDDGATPDIAGLNTQPDRRIAL